MDTPEPSDNERAGLPQATAEYLDALEADVERLRSFCADLCHEENLAIEGEYKTEMRKLVDEVERLRAITEPLDRLLDEELSQVHIFNNPPRISVCGSWTGWLQEVFSGGTIADCLEKAEAAKEAAQ